jgi:hypothetical protein
MLIGNTCDLKVDGRTSKAGESQVPIVSEHLPNTGGDLGLVDMAEASDLMQQWLDEGRHGESSSYDVLYIIQKEPVIENTRHDIAWE